MPLVTCPSCHASVEATAPACPLCGSALGTAVPGPVVPGWGPPAPPAMRAPGSVPPPLPHDTAPPAPTRRRRSPLLAVLVVVVLVAAGVVVWATTRSSESGPTSGWKEITTSSARYTVELPGEAHRIRDDAPVGGTVFPAEVLAVGDGGLDRLAPGALFIEVDLSSQPLVGQSASQPELAVALLQTQARTIFEAAGVTFTESAPVESPLGPAIRQTGTVPSQGLVVHGFAAIHGTDVIAAVAIFPTAEAADAATTLDRIVGSISPS